MRRPPEVVTPTDAENRGLIRRHQAGDVSARDELIARNTPLVITLSKRFRRNYHDRQDLVQEGLIGLLTSLERFDLERETKFSSYARDWIMHYQRQWMYRRSLVQVPRWVQMPSQTEDPRPRQAGRYQRNFDEAVRLGSFALADTDSIYAEDPDRRTSIAIALSSNEGGESPAETAEEVERMRCAMARCLDDRERIILDRHFGNGETSTEIADDLHISSKYVRVIQSRSLVKLRRVLARETV